MGGGRTWRLDCNSYSQVSSSVPLPPPPKDSLNEFLIRKLNPLVVAATSIKLFKSAFLHA